MTSLVSVESISVTTKNIDKYMTLVKALDPDVYAIKVALLETKVNPQLVPKIIRAMSNIAYGTGFGNVSISMSERKIAQITAKESEMVNEPALLID